jgi:hypothetical protein
VTIPKGVISSKHTNITSTLYDFLTFINIAYDVLTVIVITNNPTVSHNILRASSCLQECLPILQNWLQTWKIKINESKSAYITFTLRNDPSQPIYLNNVEIPPSATVKYLGLHLDNKLNWKDHIIKKRK